MKIEDVKIKATYLSYKAVSWLYFKTGVGGDLSINLGQKLTTYGVSRREVEDATK